MKTQDLKEMQMSMSRMKKLLELTRDSLVEIGRIAYYLDTKLNEETKNVKEYSFNEASISLNNFVGEYIDMYSPRTFDSDELGNIEYDRENNSMNIYFDVDNYKIQEIIRDGIESFICAWEEKTLQERKSSTDEV